MVGGFDVGDFDGGFVPLDGLLGADGEISEEDEFGEGAESSKFEEGRPCCYLSEAMAAR